MDAGDDGWMELFPAVETAAPAKKSPSKRAARGAKAASKPASATSDDPSAEGWAGSGWPRVREVGPEGTVGRGPEALPFPLDLCAELRGSLEERVGRAMRGLSEGVLGGVAELLTAPRGAGEGLTAALVELGPNYGDHPARLAALRAAVEARAQGRLPVASLNVAAVPNVKRARQEIIAALLHHADGNHDGGAGTEEDWSDEEESVFERSPKKRRRATVRLSDEEEAAEVACPTAAQPKDFLSLQALADHLQARSLGTSVLVVVEELEGFGSGFLNDLVGLLSGAEGDGALDARLLVGLSTAQFAVAAALRPSAMARLRPKTFHFPAPEPCLQAALEVVQLTLAESSLPVLLAADLLQQLVSEFRLKHLSWKGLLRRLNFALLKHCMDQQPFLPFLSQPPWLQQGFKRGAISSDTGLWDHLPSAKDKAQDKELRAQAAQLESLAQLRKTPCSDSELLAQAMEEVQSYVALRPLFLGALYTCLRRLPDTELGGSLVELELAASKADFFATEAWEEAQSLLGHLERTELESLVAELLALCDGFRLPLKAEEDFADGLRDFAKRLTEVEQLQAKLDKTTAGKKKPLGPSQSGAAASSEASGVRASRFAHQAELKAKLGRRAETDAYFLTRQRLLAFLFAALRRGLRPAAELPLHELYVVRPAEPLELKLRAELPHALLHPPAQGHDASVLFRLYRTATTKTLHTKDLFARFQQELDGVTEEQEKDKKTKKTPATPAKKAAATPAKKTPARKGAKVKGGDLAQCELEKGRWVCVEAAAVAVESEGRRLARFFVGLGELELAGVVKASEGRPGVVQRLFGLHEDLQEDSLKDLALDDE